MKKIMFVFLGVLVGQSYFEAVSGGTTNVQVFLSLNIGRE